jgi:hypothetical protein
VVVFQVVGDLDESARGARLNPDVTIKWTGCGALRTESASWQREAPRKPQEFGEMQLPNDLEDEKLWSKMAGLRSQLGRRRAQGESSSSLSRR